MILDLDSMAPGFDPEKGWRKLDFDAATEALRKKYGEDSEQAKFYQNSENRLMAILADWRERALMALIPPACHIPYLEWLKKNAASKKPIPTPFDRWGLQVEILDETVKEQAVANVITTKGGSASEGFERRHELHYGRRLIAWIEYALMPLSEAINANVGMAAPVWGGPASWCRFTEARLAQLFRDPEAVRKVGPAWVSAACHGRASLIAAVKHHAGHLYPAGAVKLRFLGPDKAHEKLVEVDPDHPHGVPVWALGELPK